MEMDKESTYVYKKKDGTNVLINLKKRIVTYKSSSVKFTPNEWKILKVLGKASPEAVKRNDLMHLIWGIEDSYPTRIVDVHISNIRSKLEYIRLARVLSVYGVGYKLVLSNRY